MPENIEKMAAVRIFRQIPAKIGPESQYLWGLPEGTVEMTKARLGRCPHRTVFRL